MLATGTNDGAVGIWATPQMSDQIEQANEAGYRRPDLLHAFQSGRIVATISSTTSPACLSPSGIAGNSARSRNVEEALPGTLMRVVTRQSTHSNRVDLPPEQL